MQLKDLTPENPKTHNVSVYTKHNSNHVCNLIVETVFKPMTYNQTLVNEYLNAMQMAVVEAPYRRGLLVVIVHEARYLGMFTHSGTCNSYVSLMFRGESRKTKVCYF